MPTKKEIAVENVSCEWQELCQTVGYRRDYEQTVDWAKLTLQDLDKVHLILQMERWQTDGREADTGRGKRKIIDRFAYPHPDDAKFLSLVLCKWGREWVTWTHNSQTDGYSGGRYFTKLSDAALAFEDRKAELERIYKQED